MVRGRVDGKMRTSLLSERCLIGAPKRGSSDAPRAVEERQIDKGERGKAPPIRGAKEKEDIEEI